MKGNPARASPAPRGTHRGAWKASAVLLAACCLLALADGRAWLFPAVALAGYVYWKVRHRV